MSKPTCACGLRRVCKYANTPEGNTLQCPAWTDHVRPKWYEKIVGAIVAFFMGW